MNVNQNKTIPLNGLLHLLVIYFVWGSTFLAMRVAVMEGSGIGPFAMPGVRLLLAGPILLLFAFARKKRILPTKDELKILSISAILMWVMGHGGFVWAEQYVDSGLAALVVGISPLVVVLIESILDRKLPTKLQTLGTVLGFAGVIVITYPLLERGVLNDIKSVVIMLISVISWNSAVVYLSRRPIKMDVMVSSGWQQFIAAIGFSILFVIAGEKIPNPSTSAMMAWVYLLVFGSLIAFTSYISAIRILPTSLVLTHAYVNPVVAVFLGWIVLSEEVTSVTYIGIVLILLGVAVVFRDRKKNAQIGH
jgi:drug/metabolite transporter (DMT)-like permease